MTEIAPGHAKSAGIVGILILIVALIDFIVGIVWVTYGGKDAAGIWCGMLVSWLGFVRFSDRISLEIFWKLRFDPLKMSRFKLSLLVT